MLTIAADENAREIKNQVIEKIPSSVRHVVMQNHIQCASEPVGNPFPESEKNIPISDTTTTASSIRHRKKRKG